MQQETKFTINDDPTMFTSLIKNCDSDYGRRFVCNSCCGSKRFMFKHSKSIK